VGPRAAPCRALPGPYSPVRASSAQAATIGPGSVWPVDLRLLTEADAQASTTMSAHAFGMPPAELSAFTLGPEVRRWGLLDGAVLAAKANERSYDSMIGGRPVPTAGVAGVAVAPEYRGTGLARRMMTHLLSTARDRGAVIATLFRTAPALYRSLGFEQVAEVVYGSLPTAALRGVRPTSTTLRRAVPADVEEVRNVYRAVAAAGSCLLTREGPAFDNGHGDLIGQFDGVTLAEDSSGVVGYACWNRGTGYGPSAVLEVVELLATTGDGYRALLSAVEAFDAVTPTVHLRTSGDDPVHWLISGAGWAVHEIRQYMLRVIDARAAVDARGWPVGAVVDTTIELNDAVCPWNTGRYRLLIGEGSGQLLPTQDAGVATVLDARALAVLFAGGVQVSALRRAGLVGGGDAVTDAALDAAFAGPRPAVLDYF
jgi:predicted acetyltransferase